MKSIARRYAIWAVLLALGLSVSAFAQESPQAPAAAEPSPSASEGDRVLDAAPPVAAGEGDTTVERIETLRAEMAKLRDDVAASEKEAAQAEGDDLIALRTRATDKRLEIMKVLEEFVAAVKELEADGGDASGYRAELAAFLPKIPDSLKQHLEAAEDSLKELKKKRDEAPAEERVAIQQEVTRQSEVVSALLDAGVDVVEMTESLEIDAPQAREMISKELDEGSVVIAGRMELVNQQLADAQARLAAAPTDAAALAETQTLGARLKTDSAELSTNVALMDRLGLETAKYKQQLITTTGEITTDVFNQEVATGLLTRWVRDMREGLVDNGPGFVFKVLLFVLVLGAFWLLSRFVRKVTTRAVEAPHLGFSELLKRMIVSMASGVVMVMGLLVALSQLGIQVAPLLAGLGIAGFVLGFALQETLANFAAGVMILIYRPFDVGDMIDCAGGVYGKVSHMNLVSTTVLTVDNQTKIVPNGKIWGDVITNLTAQKHRRIDLTFGIGYEDDIAKAEEVLWSVIKEHPKVLPDPEPMVRLNELGDSSVNFIVRPWATRDDYWDVHWDILREVKMRFDREGISIPFPQTDVHFYPAQANGGASLSTAATQLGQDRTAATGQTQPEAEDET